MPAKLRKNLTKYISSKTRTNINDVDLFGDITILESGVGDNGLNYHGECCLDDVSVEFIVCDDYIYEISVEYYEDEDKDEDENTYEMPTLKDMSNMSILDKEFCFNKILDIVINIENQEMSVEDFKNYMKEHYIDADKIIDIMKSEDYNTFMDKHYPLT